jgi:HPt (histidine-containing phosphotransfer) domain-containing protein
MDDFISKPIQPALMYQSVAKWLPPRRHDDVARLVRPPRRAPRATLAGDPAIIDLSVLAQVLGYHPDKIRKFAFKFLQTSEAGFSEMEQAAAAGDIQGVRDLGHRMKASARTVGAMGLGDLCQQLENLPAGDPASEARAARALIDRLWPLLAQITEHIMNNTTFADDN